MSNLICPKCGRTNDRIAFIEAFCTECYPVNIKLPSKLTLDQCTRCQKVMLRGDWINCTRGKLEDYVLSKCKGDFQTATYNFEKQVATFEMKGGVKIERDLLFDLKKTICQQCSRISGGYYQGIIQLRGNRSKMDKYAEMLIQRLAKVTFITKTEEKDEGLDLYVGNSKVVVALMVDLGVKALITKKLVGRDQGKRLYRTTFMVRLE